MMPDNADHVGIRERVTSLAFAAYDEASKRYPHAFALQRAVDVTVQAILDELAPSGSSAGGGEDAR